MKTHSYHNRFLAVLSELSWPTEMFLRRIKKKWFELQKFCFPVEKQASTQSSLVCFYDHRSWNMAHAERKLRMLFSVLPKNIPKVEVKEQITIN